jgi:hypothetical protein
LVEFSHAVDEIHTAIQRLAVNANEVLLLQSLFLRLPIVRAAELV